MDNLIKENKNNTTISSTFHRSMDHLVIERKRNFFAYIIALLALFSFVVVPTYAAQTKTVTEDDDLDMQEENLESSKKEKKDDKVETSLEAEIDGIIPLPKLTFQDKRPLFQNETHDLTYKLKLSNHCDKLVKVNSGKKFLKWSAGFLDTLAFTYKFADVEVVKGIQGGKAIVSIKSPSFSGFACKVAWCPSIPLLYDPKEDKKNTTDDATWSYWYKNKVSLLKANLVFFYEKSSLTIKLQNKKGCYVSNVSLTIDNKKLWKLMYLDNFVKKISFSLGLDSGQRVVYIMKGKPTFSKKTKLPSGSFSDILMGKCKSFTLEAKFVSKAWEYNDNKITLKVKKAFKRHVFEGSKDRPVSQFIFDPTLSISRKMKEINEKITLSLNIKPLNITMTRYQSKWNFDLSPQLSFGIKYVF